ncbi:hypothetical protein B0H19DRAFT_1018731 [Mycena capillaripes]|nr:hypothetical protein B0H19DRAFT_1018731 [Mycena capillaripes]
MRYGACTDDDIKFLESRIAGFRPQDPKINTGVFRNVSVITARNSQKDALNKLGAERFAVENDQELIEFCSIDRLSSRAVDRSKWRGCDQSEARHIGDRLRRQLWDAYPSTTSEFVPGKLSLCVGMPIMLRANDATELCITKGQEGKVVGWDSSVGPAGQNVLETLFVELMNPSKSVQIGDLPVNVVPLPRTVTHLTVLLEDDSLLSILREQVVVLLNFGMTDYTSQGKSRMWNPVDLTNCRDHRSYYVALSRGKTAEGTIILQRFDREKITSGMSGYLRQELRELEMLDEITRLKHESQLPPSVTGIYRRRLLRSFYAWRIDHRDPPHFHPSMRWNKDMGPRIPENVTYDSWRASGARGQKRKNAVVDTTQHKRKKTLHPPIIDSDLIGSRMTIPTVRRPIGMIWDAEDHSCGYDSTFTILFNIWADNAGKWQVLFSTISPLLCVLNNQFIRASSGNVSLEQARDVARRWMHVRRPLDFPYGAVPTSIDKIAAILLPPKAYAYGTQFCGACGYVDGTRYGLLEAYMCAVSSSRRVYPVPYTLSDWLKETLTKGRNRCPHCTINLRRKLTMEPTITRVPSIMIIYIEHPHLAFDRVIQFDQAGVMVRLQIRGIIYGGGGHFTCRYIASSGDVWYHDGISTGRTCLPQGNLSTFANLLDLHKCGGGRR